MVSEHKFTIASRWFTLLLGLTLLSSCVTSIKDHSVISDLNNTTYYYNNGISSAPLSLTLLLAPKDEPTFLLIENPHVNTITLIHGNNQDTLIAGDKYSFPERSNNFRQFVFEIPAHPYLDTARLMLDKTGENLSFGLRLLNAPQFSNYTSVDDRIIGFVSGFYILSLLISVIVFLYNRTKKFSYFTLYILFSLGWFFNDTGLLFAHVWPNSPSFHSSSRGIFSSLTMIFFGLYLYQNTGSKLLKGIKIAIYLLATVVGIKLILAATVATGVFPELIKKPTLYLNGVAISLIFGYIIFHLALNIRSYADDKYEIIGIIVYSFFVFQLGLRELGFQLIDFRLVHHMEAILFFSIQIVFMSLHLYYTERKRREVEARIKIANSLDQQRQMAEKLIEMEENEKQRIARNIHDEIGSLFAAIKYRVLSISQKTVLPDVQEDLEQLVMLSNHGIEKQYSVVDEMVFEVNRDKSLERAIQEKFTLLFSKLPVVFHFEMKMNQDQLSEVKKIQLYRILSELLTNTLKHASATNIYIRLNASNHIEVHYSDDGRGFDYTLAYGGMGLVNIQNRVNFLKGTLTIESNSSGSLFLITIPL